MYGSFNRFLKTDKPYFIYLENPLALYHYSIKRKTLYEDREQLERLSMTSFTKATDVALFGENSIAQKWEYILCNMNIGKENEK